MQIAARKHRLQLIKMIMKMHPSPCPSLLCLSGNLAQILMRIYIPLSLAGDNMAAISRRKTSSADRIAHIFRSMLAPCVLLNTVIVRWVPPLLKENYP